MENTIIISIFDRNEDFIEMQHKSILKHVKNKISYIIFNNASDDTQRDKINQICKNLNIDCVDIKLNFLQARDPSQIAGIALNCAFSIFKNEKIFKMDSDMFFISDIDLLNLFNENDLIYIETYNKFIWSGVFGINLNSIKDIKLNFLPNIIPNTDTFGQSCLLTSNNKYNKYKMQLYCILNDENNAITASINNCCLLKIKNEKIIEIENNLFDYLKDTIPQKFLNIKNNMLKYNFPKPYNIDLITINETDSIFHFKSANWCSLYKNVNYKNQKKEALRYFLENN